MVIFARLETVGMLNSFIVQQTGLKAKTIRGDIPLSVQIAYLIVKQ
jgi:hypothetical protein